LDEKLITKTGGHADQLSRSRWGLDRYRVKALTKIFRSGRLTPLQKFWTASEIARKAGILEKGYRNRAKQKQASQYQRLAAEWRLIAASLEHPKN
jgi:hypothetical protein